MGDVPIDEVTDELKDDPPDVMLMTVESRGLSASHASSSGGKMTTHHESD